MVLGAGEVGRQEEENGAGEVGITAYGAEELGPTEPILGPGELGVTAHGSAVIGTGKPAEADKGAEDRMAGRVADKGAEDRELKSASMPFRLRMLSCDITKA